MMSDTFKTQISRARWVDFCRAGGRTLALASLGGLLLTGPTACAWVDELDLPLLTPTGQPLDAPTVARAYPEELPIGEPLEIEVIREGNAIWLDNRTGRRYANAELWLNHEYGGPIDEIPIGRTGGISLASFTNHFGETYPVGRFLQPEVDRSLVLADLVIDGEVRKLTVRLDPDWRPPRDTQPGTPRR